MQPFYFHALFPLVAFLAAYAVWMVPELLLGARHRNRSQGRSAEQSYDRGSGSIILLGILLLPGILVALAGLLPSTSIARHRTLLFTAGIVVMVLGVALRWLAVRALGRQFSPMVAIQPNHEIVSDGLYRFVRHPSYSGTMTTLLGVGMTTDNWLSILVAAVGGLGIYSYRVTVEERTLLREMGEDYRRYMGKTKRFIPWIY